MSMTAAAAAGKNTFCCKWCKAKILCSTYCNLNFFQASMNVFSWMDISFTPSNWWIAHLMFAVVDV